MGKSNPVPGIEGQTLDMQVLDGLESYIATEEFLHKLEQASAEWIDLSEHEQQQQQQQHAPKLTADGLEFAKVSKGSNKEAAATAAAPAEQQSVQGSAQQQQATSTSSISAAASSSSRSTYNYFFSRRPAVAKATVCNSSTGSGNSVPATAAASSTATAADTAATVAESELAGPAAFELVEQQAPLHYDLQEPFVLVSSDDAIEGMAYYIALYLARAPEARHMEPKQLQEALRATFTAIRRRRYRVVLEWGRWLYRCCAVSYSALQLYEHPWLVRAVVSAIWTSSKLAMGILV